MLFVSDYTATKNTKKNHNMQSTFKLGTGLDGAGPHSKSDATRPGPPESAMTPKSVSSAAGNAVSPLTKAKVSGRPDAVKGWPLMDLKSYRVWVVESTMATASGAPESISVDTRGNRTKQPKSSIAKYPNPRAVSIELASKTNAQKLRVLSNTKSR